MEATVVFNPHGTVPLAKFHEELWFEFRDLPEQLFDYYLLRVARDMASRSPIIRRRVKFAIQPRVTRYYLDCPDELDLKSILDIRHIPTGNPEEGSRKIPRFFNAPERIGAFSDGAWFDPAENVLTLHTTHCGGLCAVVMSAMPRRDACELPQEYYEDYLPALIMGTRAQILMISGRPWTNLRVGADLHNTYAAMVADLGVDELRNKQAGAIRMRHGRVM